VSLYLLDIATGETTVLAGGLMTGRFEARRSCLRVRGSSSRLCWLAGASARGYGATRRGDLIHATAGR
jgi:hypothetical protein